LRASLISAKKPLLSAAGVLAVAVPFTFGALHATPSRADSQTRGASDSAAAYETASIKPNQASNHIPRRILFKPDYEFTANSVTLQGLIGAAYDVEGFEISGGPNWLKSEQYDVKAKPSKSVADALQDLSPEQRFAENERMLQALLADRFKLALHCETREQLPVYALVIAKNGPKLHEVNPSDADTETTIKLPNGLVLPFLPGQQAILRNQIVGKELPIANLVKMLTAVPGRTVVDKTDLTGKYDWNFQWTPDPGSTPMCNRSDGTQNEKPCTVAPKSSGPSIFTAIEEQLGLKLESQEGTMEILVIDHAEEPAAN